MNFEEFLQPAANDAKPVEETVEELKEQEPEELDVQKAVVESLAADKAALDDEINRLRGEIESLKGEVINRDGIIARKTVELQNREEEISALKAKILELSDKINEVITRQMDLQERNPNALALLDRDVDLPDRFPGETRDHVIEVIKEAKDRCEGEGRIRRAQILEAVLVANEPNGNLAKRRNALEKLFNQNANVINGQVIEELNKLGISYKNGEEYLLISEILMRNF